jgi:hypothetical protein
VRTLTFPFFVVTLAACSSPPAPPLVPQVPALQREEPRAVVPEWRRAESDRSPAESPRGTAFEEPRIGEPVYRTVVHTVEVPTYVEVPSEPRTQWRAVDHGGVWAEPYGSYGYHGYYEPYGYRRARRSTFPVNTLLGAGLGAVIGHQSGRRDRGALIGGGLGLLFDLPRWLR